MSRHRQPESPTTLAEHLRRMRSEFPNLRPSGEEDDVNWWNDGLAALAEGGCGVRSIYLGPFRPNLTQMSRTLTPCGQTPPAYGRRNQLL
jgi:hypothetical protein